MKDMKSMKGRLGSGNETERRQRQDYSKEGDEEGKNAVGMAVFHFLKSPSPGSISMLYR